VLTTTRLGNTPLLVQAIVPDRSGIVFPGPDRRSNQCRGRSDLGQDPGIPAGNGAGPWPHNPERRVARPAATGDMPAPMIRLVSSDVVVFVVVAFDHPADTVAVVESG
jgi:hypothetical protein